MGKHTIVKVLIAILSVFSYVPMSVAGTQADAVLVKKPVYNDKNNYFRFRPPEGWKKKEFDDPRSKVEFYVPMPVGANRKASLFFLSHPVSVISSAGALDIPKESQNRVSRLKKLGARDARFEMVDFSGVKAAQIDATLPRQQVRMHSLWFKKYDRSYTISFTTTPAFYSQYLPVVNKALATFQCIPPTGAEEVTHEEQAKIQKEKIRVLITALSDPDMGSDAEASLSALGDAAVPALTKIEKTGTAIQKERARRILKKIGDAIPEAEEQRKSQAVIGVKNVDLSRDKDFKSRGPSMEPGAKVSILEEAGDAIKVRFADGSIYWCRRIYICTPEEMRIRQRKGQIPDDVTFMGLADDGAYKLYGHLTIRNNRAVLLPGQALWFDHEVCKRKKVVDWGGSKIRPKIDALYLILDRGLLELPAWPNNRTQKKAPETKKSPPPVTIEKDTGITITGVIANLKDVKRLIRKDSCLQLVRVPASRNLPAHIDGEGRISVESDLPKAAVPADGLFRIRFDKPEYGAYAIAAQLFASGVWSPTNLLPVNANASLNLDEIRVIFLREAKDGSLAVIEIPENLKMPTAINLDEVIIPLP